MGRQVNFYATPEDIALLEQALRKLEPLAVLHARSPRARPRLVDTLALAENGQSWLYFYLVRESDIQGVAMRQVPAQEYWTVDSLRSPVIEFTSCYFDGALLRRGRAHYDEGFYGEEDAWVDKPEAFRAWANSVLMTIKKNLSKRRSDYIGPDAASRERQAGLKFVT